MPDSKIKKGLAEPLIQKLKVNDIIQFERLGFCRLDKKTSSKLIFYYTHK
jgi:glutamyl-tRNA synthetase